MKKLLTEKNQMEFLEAVGLLRKQYETGDAKAGYALCAYLDPHNEAIPLYWRQQIRASDSEFRQLCVETFSLLEREARKGDGESMHLVALFFQAGMPPVARDLDSFRDWCERAVEAGYLFAANDLYSLYFDPKSQLFDQEKARRFREIIDRANQRVVL